MPTEYKLKGTLVFDEYLECHKILAAKRRWWVRSILTVNGLVIVLYGILMAPSHPDPATVAIGALFVVYALVLSPMQFKYRVKRNWDRYPRIKKEFEITVLPDGVESRDDKGHPAHTSWESFVRFQESESLFLLYLSPLLPLCLPKRLVPPTDLDGLRAILESSIGNPTRMP